MPGFTLKKKDFFKNAPAIAVFAVGGTFVSTLVFGLLTYFLVIIHVVSRSALGPAPLTECMLYGAEPWACFCHQPCCCLPTLFGYHPNIKQRALGPPPLACECAYCAVCMRRKRWILHTGPHAAKVAYHGATLKEFRSRWSVEHGRKTCA